MLQSFIGMKISYLEITKVVSIICCSYHLPIVNLSTVTKAITVQQCTEKFIELGLLNFIATRIDFSRIGLVYFILI